MSLTTDFRHIDVAKEYGSWKRIGPSLSQKLQDPTYRANFAKAFIDELGLDGDFANKFDNQYDLTHTIHATAAPGAAQVSKGVEWGGNVVRRVRTPAGVRRFKQPLRTVIRPDAPLSDFDIQVKDLIDKNPRSADEELFSYHARLLRTIPDVMTRVEVLARIRERYKPDPICFMGARAWRQRKGMPEPKIDWDTVQADPRKTVAVAQAWMGLPDAPDDPKVKAAYDDFRRQTDEMYRFMTEELGIEVIFQRFEPGQEPYPTAEAQNHDVTHHRRIVIDSRLGEGHPIIPPDEYARFRAVHDVFGHAAVGSGFDRHGEYAAWLSHMSMYTGIGAQAMATEYHGTNSVAVTYGPQPWKAVLLPAHLIGNPFDQEGNWVRKMDVSKLREIPCRICGRPMKDPVSIKLGFGPSHMKQKVPGVQRKIDMILRSKGLSRAAAQAMAGKAADKDDHQFVGVPRNTGLRKPAQAKGQDIPGQVPFTPVEQDKGVKVGHVAQIRTEKGGIVNLRIDQVDKDGAVHGVILDDGKGVMRGDPAYARSEQVEVVRPPERFKPDYVSVDENQAEADLADEERKLALAPRKTPIAQQKQNQGLGRERAENRPNARREAERQQGPLTQAIERVKAKPKMGDYVGVRHVGLDKRGKIVRVGRVNVDVEVPIKGGKEHKIVRNVKITDLKPDPQAARLLPMGGAKARRAFLPGGQLQPRDTADFERRQQKPKRKVVADGADMGWIAGTATRLKEGLTINTMGNAERRSIAGRRRQRREEARNKVPGLVQLAWAEHNEVAAVAPGKMPEKRVFVALVAAQREKDGVKAGKIADEAKDYAKRQDVDFDLVWDEAQEWLKANGEGITAPPSGQDEGGPDTFDLIRQEAEDLFDDEARREFFIDWVGIELMRARGRDKKLVEDEEDAAVDLANAAGVDRQARNAVRMAAKEFARENRIGGRTKGGGWVGDAPPAPAKVSDTVAGDMRADPNWKSVAEAAEKVYSDKDAQDIFMLEVMRQDELRVNDAKAAKRLQDRMDAIVARIGMDPAGAAIVQARARDWDERGDAALKGPAPKKAVPKAPPPPKNEGWTDVRNAGEQRFGHDQAAVDVWVKAVEVMDFQDDGDDANANAVLAEIDDMVDRGLIGRAKAGRVINAAQEWNDQDRDAAGSGDAELDRIIAQVDRAPAKSGGMGKIGKGRLERDDPPDFEAKPEGPYNRADSPAGKHFVAGGDVWDAPNEGLAEFIIHNPHRFVAEGIKGKGGISGSFGVRDLVTGKRYFVKQAEEGGMGSMKGDGFNEVLFARIYNKIIPGRGGKVRYAADPNHKHTWVISEWLDDVVDPSGPNAEPGNANGALPLANHNEWLALHLLDFVANQTDRHHGNWQEKIEGGKRRIVIYDHGAAAFGHYGPERQGHTYRDWLNGGRQWHLTYIGRFLRDYYGGRKANRAREVERDIDAIMRLIEDINIDEYVESIIKTDKLEGKERVYAEATAALWKKRLARLKKDRADVIKWLAGAR